MYARFNLFIFGSSYFEKFIAPTTTRLKAIEIAFNFDISCIEIHDISKEPEGKLQYLGLLMPYSCKNPDGKFEKIKNIQA